MITGQPHDVGSTDFLAEFRSAVVGLNFVGIVFDRFLKEDCVVVGFHKGQRDEAAQLLGSFDVGVAVVGKTSAVDFVDCEIKTALDYDNALQKLLGLKVEDVYSSTSLDQQKNPKPSIAVKFLGGRELKFVGRVLLLTEK